MLPLSVPSPIARSRLGNGDVIALGGLSGALWGRGDRILHPLAVSGHWLLLARSRGQTGLVAKLQDIYVA